MNYTREPIIETVITPKEGYKLIVRNSKGSGQEEYAVDAIEVVSFGNSFFFRSLERPKSFLVPVSDYEVVEARETRVVLKNASFERTIKIGGGREANVKSKEKVAEEPAAVEQRTEKKKERRRSRRRRSSAETATEEKTETVKEEGKAVEEEANTPPSPPRPLIPPPGHLISDKFAKEKSEPVEEAKKGEETPKQPAVEEEASKPAEKPKRGRKKKVEAAPEEVSPKEEEPPTTEEGGEVQRIAAEASEEALTSTSFSSTEDKGKFSFFGKTW